MSTASAGQTVRHTKVVCLPCPQCGSAESVCAQESAGDVAHRFVCCPHCGFASEDEAGDRRQWKGHGVYVVSTGEGQVKAGAFDRPIPDNKVTAVVAHFLNLGPAALYLTRWNEAEGRLEVLLGGGE